MTIEIKEKILMHYDEFHELELLENQLETISYDCMTEELEESVSNLFNALKNFKSKIIVK